MKKTPSIIINSNTETKKFLRANKKQKFPVQHTTERELVYVAPDACIWIDLEWIGRGRSNKAIQEYMSNLNLLLRFSKARNGEKFAKGLVVMMLMPATREELSTYQGKYHDVIERILRKYAFVVEIDEQYEQQFKQLESQLVKAYMEKELFTPTQAMDAKLVAQASIFNIPVVSRDNHIVGKENSKIEKIKEINKEILGTYEHQAFPIKIKTFVSRVAKHNPSPAPDNFVYLTKGNQKELKSMNNGKVKISYHYDEDKKIRRKEKDKVAVEVKGDKITVKVENKEVKNEDKIEEKNRA